MSDLNSQKMLNRKTNRNKKFNSILNKTKNKIISNQFQLRKKSKKKVIKKLISYQNSPTKNLNSKNNSEKSFIDEENNDKKKDDCYQESSLGQLTKNFLNYIKTKGNKSINIKDLVNELNVKKRRIYDITNVLQGMGYLQKSGKNEIIWTKQISNKAKNKKRKNNYINNNQKTNAINLEKEENKLEKDINIFIDEFNSISKKNDFSQYGYITMDDLKNLANKNNIDLLILKLTKGTVMNILDNKDIKNVYNKVNKLMENGQIKKNEILLNILKKNNQLMFNCPRECGLNFYYVKNGELKEIGKKKNNRNINIINSNENNVLPKYVHNNFNINNLIENNNYNVAINYNLNINNDNFVRNNMYNNPINNNSFFDKNSFVNYNKIENNFIFPNNIIIKNEENNIGVYASSYNKNNNMKNIFNSNYDINLFNYKN